ncbi:MAG TPA: FecR family protein [Candidatus Dormibacteraeota bacterium]|nr:FecR family protein [Candidatus Dormibacteraeota bacterium]
MIVIVTALLLGSGYFFLVAQAQAGVASPAALLVFSTPVDVGHNDSGYKPAASGQSLDAGSSVRTGGTGRATIQFPDGTLTRLSPNTTVTVQAAQLSNGGQLKSATLLQKIGRTLSVVQHLAGGADFNVGGHAVSAEVRGTEFEVLVRGDGSNLIKVFDGTVKVSGKTSVNVTAGQEIDADNNGNLSRARPIRPDPQDPYPLIAQCERAVSGGGNSAGTLQVSTGDALTTGQTAESDYQSGGGVVSVALCYPGSFMTLSVTDPNGVVHASRQSGSPVTGHIDGPPGLWRALVRAVDVPGGEPWAVAWETNAVCGGEKVDTGAAVREVLSNAQLSSGLADSGTSGVTIQVQGVSSNSARIYYYSNIGGIEISWTIDFYAATPNLGWVLTQITVRGVNITTQVMDRLTAAGASISSIPTDYIVDRVYSCVGPEGNTMVIEGHR